MGAVPVEIPAGDVDSPVFAELAAAWAATTAEPSMRVKVLVSRVDGDLHVERVTSGSGDRSETVFSTETTDAGSLARTVRVVGSDMFSRDAVPSEMLSPSGEPAPWRLVADENRVLYGRAAVDVSQLVAGAKQVTRGPDGSFSFVVPASVMGGDPLGVLPVTVAVDDRGRFSELSIDLSPVTVGSSLVMSFYDFGVSLAELDAPADPLPPAPVTVPPSVPSSKSPAPTPPG